MDSQQPIKIFISYAHRDGAELAQRLLADLTKQGFDVWLDVPRRAGGDIWTSGIEEALDQAQVVLALLTQGAYFSEICRAQQLRGLRTGKCVIPLLAQHGAKIPLHLEARNYRAFTAATQYEQEFQRLLEDIRGGRGVEPKPEYLSTYVTAPPLPVNYVERTEESKALRDALFAEGGGRHIALTALQGMGGIGKTVLAQALCHDAVVQQAFPDGIVWITAGKKPAHDLVTRMREAGKALHDDLSRYDAELGCINRYRAVIREKAVLIVIDDVWRSRDIEPFLCESPRSRLLFTTRDTSLAAALGAREHPADLLTEPQSRDILARWSGRNAGDLPPQAAHLIQECGRLPLALAMVGAMLRGKPPAFWKRVRGLLRNADLEKIKAQFPDYPHTDLFRALQVSVDAVDAATRERYVQLAVLLEHMPAPPAILQSLWGVDEAEALETADRLTGLSLAQRDGDCGGIRLHDLQLDYVRAQYPDREALDLIRGAVRLSSHVIEKDPSQFASQIVGRLLPYQGQAAIRRFTEDLIKAAPRPWLRPLQPALAAPGTGLIRTLEGHSSWVNGVAVSPDGRWAVSASSDHTLKVWDLETGRGLHTLEGHSSPVNGVAVSPDGLRAVSASHDQTLKVWDLETGRELHTLKGHSAAVTGVAVSPDGRRAVSASDDKTLKVWDLETGRELCTLEGHSSGVTSVAVSPDGRRAVSASWEKTLKVWDLETGRALRTLEGHSNIVAGVAVSPDGWRAVSAAHDHTLKVWDLETGRELRTLKGHSFWVTGVAVSPDGRWAVSASSDNTLKVWDLETGRELRTLEGHASSVTGVAVSPDGRRAVSASSDKTLKVWDLETGRELRSLDGHSNRVQAVAVSPDGRRAVSASWDRTLKVWDLETGRELRTLEGHALMVTGVALSPDGRRAVSTCWDNTLKVWDLETGRELRTLEGHALMVNGVAVSPDGRWAVSASWDRTLKVWDLETGRALRTLEGHSSGVAGVAVSPDGRWAVSASHDKTLKVWDLNSGQELRALEGHSSKVNGVAVSPDGRRAVSVSGDNTLKVWDLETGRGLRTLEGHSSPVNGVAVSPDGRWAVSASSDHALKVWDLETGMPLATFTCDAPAQCCAFAGSRVIIAGDAAGRVHFLSFVSDF
jgi:WD40 repeat protein